MRSVPWYGAKGVAMNGELSIGRLANTAGVNVETIRYYQRRGLVAKPYKPLDGRRRYASSAAARVRLIKRAQQFGFTLEEVSRLLAEHKLALIEERIADLNCMRQILQCLIVEYAPGQQPRSCPIIATLSADPG